MAIDGNGGILDFCWLEIMVVSRFFRIIWFYRLKITNMKTTKDKNEWQFHENIMGALGGLHKIRITKSGEGVMAFITNQCIFYSFIS